MHYLIAFVLWMLITYALVMAWVGEAQAATVHTVHLPIVQTSVQFSSIGPVIGGG
jgi:hypothetical protein